MTPLATCGTSMYVEAGASSSTWPRSESSITSAAVNVLVMLANAIPDCGTSGVPRPSTPAAPRHTPSGVTTAAVTPGIRPLLTQRAISPCSRDLFSVGRSVAGLAGHTGEPAVCVLEFDDAGATAGVPLSATEHADSIAASTTAATRQRGITIFDPGAPFSRAREAFASPCQVATRRSHQPPGPPCSLSLHDGARLGFLNRSSRASGPMVARRRSLTTATIPTTRTTTKRMSNHHTADLPPRVYYPTGSPQIGITRRRRLLIRAIHDTLRSRTEWAWFA